MLYTCRLLKYKLPFLMAAFLFFNLSCAPQKKLNSTNSKDPKKGGAIVVASIGDARTLIPLLATDSASATITSQVYSALLRYDKNIELEGELAKSWDIEDGGLKIIFHLREDVNWHDGHPFTAKDVEFTYNKLIDPAVKTAYSGDFKKVKEFNILD